MIDLSIIIVSYNTKEFLKRCLQSIQDHKPEKISYEVIVVDNASKDGSASEISRLRQGFGGQANLKSIENIENVGFSKANNIGIRESKGRYILFLNPDTVMKEDTLKKMVEFMDDNKEVGAATCKVVLPDGKLDDACHRGFPTPWNAFCHFSGLSRLFYKSRLFNGYNLGWMDIDKVHEIDSCAGAFMMVRRTAGDQINWWDEDYFWYGEDLDFCYRLKGKGWKIYFAPTVSIMHYKGVSGGIKKISKELTTADRETKTRATKARFEAMRIFYKKHYRNKYSSFITWFVMKTIDFKLGLSLKSLQ